MKPPKPHPTLTKYGTGQYTLEFDSVSQMNDMAGDWTYAASDAARQSMDEHYRQYKTAGNEWTEDYTFKSYATACDNPPQKLLTKVEDFRRRIEDYVNMNESPKRFRRRRLDFGDDMDCDRFLQKIPELWERMDRRTVPARIIRIGINLTVHCGHSTETMLPRGAAVIALADHLTRKGYGVEILGYVAIDHLSSQCRATVMTVPIKPSGVPVDSGSVIMLACGPVGFRLAALAAMVRALPDEASWGLGSPGRLSDKQFSFAETSQCDHLADGDVFSEKQALDWIKTVCGVYSDEKQGV